MVAAVIGTLVVWLVGMIVMVFAGGIAGIVRRL